MSTDIWGAVANFFEGLDIFHHDETAPLHSTDTDSGSSASSTASASQSAAPHLVLAPNVTQAAMAAFEARLGHSDSQQLTLHNQPTPVATPIEQAVQKLLDAVDHGSHLGDPIKPDPSPVDPDLGDPNKPPHPTPIGHGGESGLHGVPSVLTNLAIGAATTGHIADGTSNTVTVGERAVVAADLGHSIPTSSFTAALSGLHPAVDAPFSSHGGGVIDPPQTLHVADLHVANQALDLSALHLDHAPPVHFDAIHH